LIAPVLVVAIGNRSRGDDALGPLLLDRLRTHLDARSRPHPHAPDRVRDVDLLEVYQLQIEHSLDLRGRERVLFVDACVGLAMPFRIEPVAARTAGGAFSHALSPAALLDVHRRVFGEDPPPCWLLSVAGDSFELGEGLGGTARAHADAAWPALCAFVDQSSNGRPT
jgi:hydrogenase maturation protease